MDLLQKLPKLSSVDGRIVMQEMYETRYGIWNHTDPNNRRPLAGVAFHDVEDINEGSLLQEAIRTYVKRRVGEYTRLSLTEFLDLPIDIVAMVLKICEDETKKKDTTLAEVERSLGVDKS